MAMLNNQRVTHFRMGIETPATHNPLVGYQKTMGFPVVKSTG